MFQFIREMETMVITSICASMHLINIFRVCILHLT